MTKFKFNPITGRLELVKIVSGVYVPFTGATLDVDLGNKNLKGATIHANLLKADTLSGTGNRVVEANDQGEQVADRGIEELELNHVTQEGTPTATLYNAGNTWTRPSDQKKFELVVSGIKKYWVEITSPKTV